MYQFKSPRIFADFLGIAHPTEKNLQQFLHKIKSDLTIFFNLSSKIYFIYLLNLFNWRK